MIDLVVAGGGPIGLAAAIEARMAGLAVAVVEPRPSPIDKACGEGLMPGAVAALARLGVDPAGHPLVGIGYRDGRRRVDHLFRAGPGRGVRRTVLHAALTDRARELGVEVVPDRVVAVEQHGDSVTVRMAGAEHAGPAAADAESAGPSSVRVADGIRARWMIGADGLHSTVRELAGLAPARASAGTPVGTPVGSARAPVAPARTPRFGLRRHFAVAPWSELVEVYWTPALEHGPAEIYLTPVVGVDGAAELGVAVLGPRLTDYEEAIRSVPELAERLAGAEPTTELRGAGPLRQHSRAWVAGRVLLVGDASGYVDALTGEGIRVGLAQARVAIRCLVAGEPHRYEREWRRSTRDYRMLTSGLVALGASPLRRVIVPAASALPVVYGAIVERLAR